MKEALGYMRRGELVPDSTVWAMVRERKSCLQCSGGFILDGIPRTLSQAESLKDLLDTEGLLLTAVVNYELPFSEIVARLGGPRTCEKCTSGVSHYGAPACFSARTTGPESITVRLEAYQRSTAPLIEFYRDQGLLLKIAGKGTPDDTFEDTFTLLEAKRVWEVARKVLVAQAESLRVSIPSAARGPDTNPFRSKPVLFRALQ